MVQPVYSQYGTHVAVADEGDESLIDFVYEGAGAMLSDHKRWERLVGPPVREVVGVYDDEELASYLWPVIARKAE